LSNNKTVRLDTAWIEERYGKRFVEACHRNQGGYVEVPVGDNKPSYLYLFPHLQKENAPTLKYTQDDDTDQCLSKSFASVLYNIGFTRSAEEINNYGMEDLHLDPVFIIERLIKKARQVITRRIQCRKINSKFCCLTQLKPGEILVGIIRDHDGNCSHGISIHNNWIYDANENVALPLCRESLDYCTMKADGTPGKFYFFKKGYVFYYAGKKNTYKKFMGLK